MVDVVKLTRRELGDFGRLKSLGLRKIRHADFAYNELVDLDDIVLWATKLSGGDLLAAHVENCGYMDLEEYCEMFGITPIFFLKDYPALEDIRTVEAIYFYYEDKRPLHEDYQDVPRYLEQLLIPFEAYIHSGIAIYPIGGCQIDRQWDVVSPAGVFIPSLDTISYILKEEFKRDGFVITSIRDIDNVLARMLNNMPPEEFKTVAVKYIVNPDDSDAVKELFLATEDMLNGEVYDIAVSVIDEDGESEIERMRVFGHELSEEEVLNALVGCYNSMKAGERSDSAR